MRENRPSRSSIEFAKSEIEQAIPDRFETIAKLAPDHLALKGSGIKVTYQDLSKVTNRIAHSILAGSGGNEETIALFFRNNAKTIIAMLGTLKAGKIYMPLDPAYPRDRLAFMLEDSGTTTVLSDSESFSEVEQISNDQINILNVDNLDIDVPDDNLDLSIEPDQYCALYYTSGSTGSPKGVLQNHRNILHRAWVHSKKNHICVSDCQTHLFSCSFTASLPDIFGALLTGATLCPYDVKREGLGLFSNWLLNEQISLFHPPVALLRQFADTLTGTESFPGIRLISLGGQSIYKNDVERFRTFCSPECVVEISLASTEASIHTQYFVGPSDVISQDFVPVGFGVEDKEIIILDDSRNELGVGEIGEIAVRSHYLSPGYWRDPELTQDKFYKDPSTDRLRIYLTGDLGRLHPEGYLEYIGRKDFQTKVRGYRVEIGEIETALHQLEIIQQAAVVVDEDDSGNTKIFAYVVPVEQSQISPSQLRSFLSNTLPGYMIPSTFIVRKDLPLTPTGKLDRNLLLQSQKENWDSTSFSVFPKDEIKAKLVDIWMDVLGVERLGIDDDFFELGGHSLLAMRLFMQIEEEFGKKLPMTSLFKAPTIEEQAKLIRKVGDPVDWSFLVPVQSKGSKPIFYCVSPIGIDVLAYRGLALQMGMDQPFYALFSHGSDFRDTLDLDLPQLASTFVEEIRSFQPSGPYYLGGYSGGGVVALEMAQQLLAVGEEIPFVALLESYGPNYPDYNPNIPEGILGLLRVVRRIDKNLKDFVPWSKMHISNLRGLNWQEKISYVQFKLKQRGELFREAIRRRLRKLESSFSQGTETFRPQYVDTWNGYEAEKFKQKAILFRAKKQPLGSYHDPILGWGDLLVGEIVVHEVPGYHDSILFGPRVHFLGKKLAEEIESDYLKPHET